MGSAIVAGRVLKIRLFMPNILFIIFFVTYLLLNMVDMVAIFRNMLIAIVGLLCLIYVFMKKSWFISQLSIGCLAASLCMCISIFYNGNANLMNLLWIWAYAGVAALIYEFCISSKVGGLIFYGIAIFYLCFMLVNSNARGILKSISENNISVQLICCASFFYLLYWKENRFKELPYIPALLMSVISAWSGSRAGVLSSILCLIMIIYYNYLYVKKAKIRTIIKTMSMILAAVPFVILFADKYLSALTRKLTNFKMGSSRIEIWKEYIEGSFDSLGNFILGVPTDNFNYPILNSYSGNTHNIFLMLHSKFGLAGLIFILALLFLAGYKIIKKRDYVLGIILSTVIIRSMFDWTAFPGVYDIFFWYCYLYCLDCGRKRRKCEFYGII